jgi:ligand-binding sensor domain-containing protein/signal transduction histidine kinase
MLRPLKQLFHIFLTVLIATTVMIGRVRAADTPFIVDVWGTEDGLPQSSVIALAQTRDGYLWLGTLNGLVRFDGNSFTRFNVNNTPGLPNNVIVFIFEDSQQTLWVGTETAGLCAIKNGVVQKFDTGGPGGKITCAYEDTGGGVWFGTQDGRFLLWKDGRFDLNPAPVPDLLAERLLQRAFHLVVPGADGISWHLQNGRVEKWRQDRLEKDFGVCPWPATQVTGIIRGRGVAFDAGVMSAIVDREGNLVVGTPNSGLYWLEANGSWRHFTTGQGLSHDTIPALCLDREGNLWAGTDGGGLNRIKRRYFSSPSGSHPWVAQSVAEDAQGGLWVAFNGRGISYLLTNSVTDYGIGIASNGWTVLVDNRQQVWAGTRGEGLFQFMSYYFQPVSAAGGIGRQVFALFQSRDGKIWAGGDKGLGSFDGASWKFYSTADGLPPNAIRALAEDDKGNLWIGTEGGGLFQLRNGRIVSAHALVDDISCLLVDRDVLWIGTSGHGLIRYQNNSWSHFAATNGLATDSIGYLVGDDAGNLWLGSYEGVMRVEKKSLDEFAAGSAKMISCRTFLTLECAVGAQPAAIRARDGRLWFPTIHGLISVNPAELRANPNPPPVIIESVGVDGVVQTTNLLNLAGNQTVTLQPDDEQLEIHFASLNFSASKGSQFGACFKYRLEGRDKNWTDIGGERVAHFQKLPPGRYVFHVKACNEDGVWNDAGATLAVTVAPPFWRKPWFVTLVILAFIGALAGIIYSISTAKLKSQLRAARQKELIEKERARIARDLHDQLGANLTQVTLLGELAEVDRHLPDEIIQHAQQITETARDTTRALDEIVWAVNPSNDTLEGLANYACKYAQDYFALAGVSFRAELPAVPPTPILPEVRHNIFLAFKEAVNNVVKHAHATEARVKLQLEPGKFVLSVTDNGRGLGDVSGKQLRNGLKNMRKRLADVHGEFEIMPGENGGTVVKLTVPISDSSS